jgi:hypothetical protein
MVRLLLENGADPSTRESPRRIGNPGRGWTPLTLAIGREKQLRGDPAVTTVWG